MGLPASIYKSQGRNFSNYGISDTHDEVVIVNVSGPSEPTPAQPAVLLVSGNVPGTAKIVRATRVDDEWVVYRDSKRVGPMMGGCYVATADGRFHEAVEDLVGAKFYGAVPLHDRYETQAEYDSLSS